MFKVTVDDVEYEVIFSHHLPKHNDRKKVTDGFNTESEFRETFGTLCVIYRGKDGMFVSMGESELSIKDSFNRNIGRKVALTKSLNTTFSGDTYKELRKAFWNAYYKARGDKW